MVSLPDKRHLNPLLLIAGICCAVSGMLLQLCFHMGHGGRGPWHTVWGLCYHTWSGVHQVTSLLLFVGVVLHLLRHGRWLRRIISRRSVGKHAQVAALTVVFVLAAALGFYAWGISMVPHAAGARHLFIEIHDKITLVLIVLLGMHVWKRRRGILPRRSSGRGSGKR